MPTVNAWSPCRYASSARTANGVLLPLVLPTGMVIVWPLLSVMTRSLPVTAAASLAV